MNFVLRMLTTIIGLQIYHEKKKRDTNISIPQIPIPVSKPIITQAKSPLWVWLREAVGHSRVYNPQDDCCCLWLCLVVEKLFLITILSGQVKNSYWSWKLYLLFSSVWAFHWGLRPDTNSTCHTSCCIGHRKLLWALICGFHYLRILIGQNV